MRQINQIVEEMKAGACRELLRDIYVDEGVIVDKLIGKAAALLLCLGEVKYVYGITMSEAGKAYLDQAGVAAACAKSI